MYTADDVYTIIDTLPLEARWAVVEYTLERIKDKERSTNASTSIESSHKYSHPILELAGIWTDKEAEEIKAAIEEDNKIDLNEW